MVARARFVATNSQRGMGDHLLQATEPAAERDNAAAYGQDLPPGEHQGTVPQPRRDMPAAVARALATDPRAVPSQSEVYELVGGKRADGGPVGRRQVRDHVRADGRTVRATDFVDITLAPDISWSLAMANARTGAGAALIRSAVIAAADDTMQVFEKEIALTRRGAGGRHGEEAGQVAWWRFEHQTPRPDQHGKVAPGFHMHHLVPNLVVTATGHTGAINLRRMKGFPERLGTYFHERLAARGAEVGLQVEMRGWQAVLSGVPEHVRDHFSRRTADAEADARAYAEGKGLRWEDLPEKRRQRLVKIGARKTEGAARDGMADRWGWRAEMATLGFLPTDLAGAARTRPVAQPWPEGASLIEKAEALRKLSVQTLQMARHLEERAAAEGQPVPSIARRSRIARAIAAAGQAARSRAVVRTVEVLRNGVAAFYARYEVKSARRLGAGIRNAFVVRVTEAAVRYAASGRLVADARRLHDRTAATVEAIGNLGVSIRSIAARRSAERAATRMPQQPTTAPQAPSHARTSDITPQQIAAVHSALRTLAGEEGEGATARNGAGFNRNDTTRGRELAAKPSLTRDEAIEGRQMVRKYWWQIGGPEALAEMGAPSLRHPPTPADLQQQAAAARDATLQTRQRAEATMQQGHSVARAAAKRQVQAAAAKAAAPAPAPAPRPAPRRRVEVSEAEAAVQLRDAIRAAGMSLPPGKDIVFDGKLHYLHVDGAKRNERNGAYRAHLDHTGAAAALYNWKQGGFIGTWKAQGEMKPIAPEDAARFAREAVEKKAAAERETARRLEAGAKRAQAIYDTAKPEDGSHPYLVAKGLGPIPGVRVNDKGQLVVPLRDAEHRIVNVQTIDPDGTKMYLPGAQKNGAAFAVGNIKPDAPAVLAEGLATAARVHNETGEGVIMCLDTSNLVPVARIVRSKLPDREIVFAADNDHHLPTRTNNPRPNAGIEAATKAAAEVGNARVWAPPRLPTQVQAGKGTDWDDVGRLQAGAVAKAWREATSAARWEAMRQRGEAASPKGPAQAESAGVKL